MSDSTRQVASLTWEGCEPPVDDEGIQEIERALGVEFPSSFREIIQSCHGGTPVERREFFYRDPTIGKMASGLGALLTLNLDDELSGILETVHSMTSTGRLPDKVIPFAEDGGGDLICLDYREDPDHPKVVYWSHEEEPERSIIPLADSFAEFLDELLPPED
jgi:cell wall assembly regulator SMI1